MGIKLQFHVDRSVDDYFIGNIYAPDSGNEVIFPGISDQFYSRIEMELQKIHWSNYIILGGDFNASLGKRQLPCDQPILGPFGLDYSNTAGERVLDLA
jgi:hypothetical protein